jgi:3',5'-cyclic AMP phosphodiesterase CpdA
MQQAQAWAAAHPLSDNPNAQTWNGGCTQQQLQWLQEQLAAAAQQQERVIVTCHHPIAPGSAPDEYLAWGYKQLQQVLTDAAGVVKLVLSGHYHPGGYVCSGGMHFVVMEGVLEAPADSNAYARVEVVGDAIKIHGSGVASSRALSI